MNEQELFDLAIASVVKIVFKVGDGSAGSGSGFIVTSDGLIVTNRHVVEAASTISVQLHNGSEFASARVIALHDQHDVALVAVAGRSLPTLELSQVVPLPGSHVVVLGAPLGLESTISSGIVSQIRGLADQEYIQVTAPISSGSSGGPLLNPQGEVIGIATLTLQDSHGDGSAQNVNMAVGATIIRDFIHSTLQRGSVGELRAAALATDYRPESDPPFEAGIACYENLAETTPSFEWLKPGPKPLTMAELDELDFRPVLGIACKRIACRLEHYPGTGSKGSALRILLDQSGISSWDDLEAKFNSAIKADFDKSPQHDFSVRSRNQFAWSVIERMIVAIVSKHPLPFQRRFWAGFVLAAILHDIWRLSFGFGNRLMDDYVAPAVSESRRECPQQLKALSSAIPRLSAREFRATAIRDVGTVETERNWLARVLHDEWGWHETQVEAVRVAAEHAFQFRAAIIADYLSAYFGSVCDFRMIGIPVMLDLHYRIDRFLGGRDVVEMKEVLLGRRAKSYLYDLARLPATFPEPLRLADDVKSADTLSADEIFVQRRINEEKLKRRER